ncbi:MAG: co-chaperone GroES [Sulfurovum sp.]|nr:co-chaperone GroES [Sulfurovum sp.]
MVKFRPIRDRVLLKRIPLEGMSSGGIVMPGEEYKKSAQAVVAAVGPGFTYEDGNVYELSVKLGEHVVAGKAAGQEIKIDGEEFWLVRDHDILYVVEHEEDS